MPVIISIDIRSQSSQLSAFYCSLFNGQSVSYLILSWAVLAFRKSLSSSMGDLGFLIDFSCDWLMFSNFSMSLRSSDNIKALELLLAALDFCQPLLASLKFDISARLSTREQYNSFTNLIDRSFYGNEKSPQSLISPHIIEVKISHVYLTVFRWAHATKALNSS